MPTTPKTTEQTADTLNLTNTVNAIRNAASPQYRALVNPVTDDVASLRSVGNILLSNPNLRNEFINTLINRIAMVIVTSKMYRNPWSIFKRGYLELGETVEEIFVRLAEPHNYDVETAEAEVFKREIPDVLSAFHVINYKKFYKRTVQTSDLRQAFLSWDGLQDFIAKIIDSMYSGTAYDEFLAMKYLLAKLLIEGYITPVNIPDATTANAHEIVTTVKGTANALTFMSTNYNMAGVENYTDFSEQYIIVNSKFDAIMDVNVLASAFNMEKAEFIGRRILVDGFGHLDINRLNKLFADDPNYIEFSQDELNALDAIPAVIVSENFFMIFDNLNEYTEIFNGQGLYWNYFYHVWKTFSASPFANAVAFSTEETTVTAVTVSPSTAQVSKGSALQLTAEVTTTGFANQLVDWAVDADGASINNMGLLSIDKSIEVASVTVTATSRFDPTQKGTATITVA